MRFWVTLLSVGLVSACATGPRPASGVTAATVVDPLALQQSGGEVPDTYVIGATDLLNISVFQVPDLTFKEVRVDASGTVQMPLIGSVRAAGRTPDELARDITEQLAERFLRNPQVSVTVAEAASQKITVDGAVTKPGVYVMRGQTSLLQAVAMAEGATDIANLETVAVFRTTPNGRMVAIFDLRAIRNGQAEDPVLRGDDVVVVDTSRLSAAIQRALRALPSFAVFGYL